MFISRRKGNSERLLTLTLEWFGFSIGGKAHIVKTWQGFEGGLENEVIRILEKPVY